MVNSDIILAPTPPASCLPAWRSPPPPFLAAVHLTQKLSFSRSAPVRLCDPWGSSTASHSIGPRPFGTHSLSDSSNPTGATTSCPSLSTLRVNRHSQSVAHAIQRPPKNNIRVHQLRPVSSALTTLRVIPSDNKLSLVPRFREDPPQSVCSVVHLCRCYIPWHPPPPYYHEKTQSSVL